MSEKQKIGYDWPLVKMVKGPLKGQIYARNPKTRELVRVTNADVGREVVELVKRFGLPKSNG